MSLQMYIICLLVISVHLISQISGVKDGLYSSEDDDVVTLNNNSFQAKVVESKTDTVWVVEFYNSWCGHCIHFAPTWKQLAADFKDWRDLIVIAAIDCSQSVNLETCRKHDINSYPTVKVLSSNVTNSKTAIIGAQNLQEIKKYILDYIVKHTPKSWPHLQPLEKIEDIWQEKKDSHEHVILIFEEAESPVGTQVILDVRSISSVLVRRMLKDNVSKYGISKFPSLYKVRPDSTYSMLAIGSKMMAGDRVTFVKTIRDLAESKEANDHQDSLKNKVKNMKPNLRNKNSGSILVLQEKYNSSVVSMQDLESALHYSFRQEIALKQVIEGVKFQTLQNFVGILLKYFPGQKPVLGFLERVHSMLNTLGQNKITGEEWVHKIDSLQDKDNYLPDVIKWESCLGSSPRFRGYPCGMWTLYHTLTVAAYNQNMGARHGHNPLEVLVAIRDYMEHFFGCRECSKNFLLMALSIEEEVRTSKDSVLWLWSAHNKANKRLRGHVSEDPEYPKIEFPLDKTCPQCHILNGETISWNMVKVLEFLVKLYSEKSIAVSRDLRDVYAARAKGIAHMSVESQEVDWWEKSLREQDLKQFMLLREKKEEAAKGYQNKINAHSEVYYSENVKSKQDGNQIFHLWGLTHIDFSLCVVFYILSTVFILTLYHHFIVRRRMIPCRNKT